jgi:exodeoxyribonuclease V beta subunit
MQQFNPINTQLLTGINLIEASAGTGKTYAIAMLVLRFVVEKGLTLEQALVVTFTKAATEELKDRIRARLAEAKRAVNGRTQGIDNTILSWLAQLNLARDLIKQRLETALLTIDQAGIFTIHGFCQRMLTEHALESGQLFNLELTADIETLKQDCADDFWRREVYLRSPLEAALLTAMYKTPDALLASVNHVSLINPIAPDFVDLSSALHELQQTIKQANQQVSDCISVLQTNFTDSKFKDSYLIIFEKSHPPLSAWLAGDTLALPNEEALSLLNTTSIMQGLNGQKFRTTKQQSGDERKAEYVAALGLDNGIFDDLLQQIQQLSVIFRRALLEDLRTRLGKRLQAESLLSFDDLISRLATALQQDKTQQLTRALQQRFHVALIDEFQDTDPQQWAIFSTLFHTPHHALYLIGDPKQAIYKFRGADIFAYLSAQRQAEHRFTLANNWRSHPHLVAAVNELFKRQQAFLFAELEFHPVTPARTVEEGYVCYQKQALAPLMLWQLAQSESETGDWTSGKAATQIQAAVVNEIVSLLNDDFCINSERVQPKNIAVLVRTNAQAHEYQIALNQAGVPAVLNNTESVYGTAQAIELYTVLQAVADPSHEGLIKHALSSDWFGLNGQQFYQLLNDEAALEQWAIRLQHYQQRWQHYGIMTMMHELLATEQVWKILSRLPQAERLLTNIQHLIELLQHVEQEHKFSPHKTLAYLAHAIEHADHSSTEAQQLRLESDADAVKIVTMHRSKGLEYDLVFCPVLWQSGDARLKQEKQQVSCHSLTDIGSVDFEAHKLQALQEQAAEELRVCYVALTRAKYRCYVAWANVRSKDQPNQSALAYLFDFAEHGFAAQQAQLMAFSKQLPAIFDYQLLPATNEIPAIYQSVSENVPLRVKPRQRHFYPTWQMSSYTALATLSSTASAELPTDKAQESDEISGVDEVILALPKGSHTGNVIHNLLEFNSFNKLADPETDISTQRDKTCARFGLQLEQPEVIDQLLRSVVSTPLSATDENFCLKNISPAQCVKEMPFYLAVRSLNINHINVLLRNCPAYQPLTEKMLTGYLTGFIDLICHYQGRYYVLDYKTNALDDYQARTLTVAMREHNYGLQYWLYSVVLHLYLQSRLADYRYEQNFGGVRYLFVRGMQAQVPMSGVYADKPDFDTLSALVALFK